MIYEQYAEAARLDDEEQIIQLTNDLPTFTKKHYHQQVKVTEIITF